MSVDSKEEGQTITLPDGRKLGYLIIGEGKPVVWFHGRGLSRLDVLGVKELADSRHLRFIGVDRPGFGLSSFSPRRTLSSFASDVSFLSDHLGIKRFALAGVSMGGHYVITCTALLSERVTRAIVISGRSLPVGASEKTTKMLFDWGTKPIVGTIIMKRYRDIVLELAKDPDSFCKSDRGRKLMETYPEADVKFFVSPSRGRDIFCRSTVESFRQGDDAIRALIQEFKLAKNGWDTDLSRIPPGLVYLWHGTADKIAPVNDAYKNVEVIPGAQLRIFENEGHMLLMNHAEELCETLTS